MEGKQMFVGPELPGLLSQLKVRREEMVDQGLSFVRRAREGARDYFIVNRSTDVLFNSALGLIEFAFNLVFIR